MSRTAPGVVVTRPRRQSSGFAGRLRALGLPVLVCPTIRIVPPRTRRPLDRVLRRLEEYDWLIFTSANGAERFGRRWRRVRRPFPKKLRTCAIGPATSEAMRSFGFPVHRVSKEYVAESILKALPPVKGSRILIPRAAVARDVLPVELRRRGASVEVVEAYRTVPDRSGLVRLRRWVREGRVGCVAFTSSSTVRNFFALLGAADRRRLKASGAVAASIGPVTTRTLRAMRWPPGIVARKPTTDRLARAIADFYTARRKEMP